MLSICFSPVVRPVIFGLTGATAAESQRALHTLRELMSADHLEDQTLFLMCDAANEVHLEVLYICAGMFEWFF